MHCCFCKCNTFCCLWSQTSFKLVCIYCGTVEPLTYVFASINQGVNPLLVRKDNGNIACTECCGDCNSCTCLGAVCESYTSLQVSSKTTSLDNSLTDNHFCKSVSEKVSYCDRGCGDSGCGDSGGGGLLGWPNHPWHYSCRL